MPKPTTIWFALALTGCASAGAPEQGTDANRSDGNSMRDASTIDGSTSRTLTQTTTQTLKAGNTLVCGNSLGTRANNFYRVFDLPALGITGPFHVTQVSFQVEHCHANANNGCTLAVRVGTYAATPGTTLDTAQMSILASNASVAVPEIVEAGTPPVTPGGTVTAPINATIPAGQRLLVEVDSPDGTNAFQFYMGSNDGGENAFGYVMAPACSINVPSNMSGVLGTAAAAPRHMLLSVTGMN